MVVVKVVDVLEVVLLEVVLLLIEVASVLLVVLTVARVVLVVVVLAVIVVLVERTATDGVVLGVANIAVNAVALRAGLTVIKELVVVAVD